MILCDERNELLKAEASDTGPYATHSQSRYRWQRDAVGAQSDPLSIGQTGFAVPRFAKVLKPRQRHRR
jgi:hypothetical protein